MTEEEHAQALDKLNATLYTKPNTKERDEFDLLLARVDTYEKKHYPPNFPRSKALVEHYRAIDKEAEIQIKHNNTCITDEDLEINVSELKV